MVVRLVLACLAIVACLGSPSVAEKSPASKANAYKIDAGPLKVTSVDDLVLKDEARNKELHVRVNYPDGTGPFPVIVFSHGAYGTKDNYQELTTHWASHGYVTIQANHSDSRALGVRPGDPGAFRDWPSRPVDISFLIDSLPLIEEKAPELRGKLDREKIGVGGHSFGANTAQLIAGAKATILSRERSFADNRVKAVLIMSGQGIGEMLTKDSWQNISLPLLVMSGTKDGPTRTGQPAEWRKEPYELSPAGNKFLFWAEGLDHGYGGVSGAPNMRLIKDADHAAWTKIETTAFWDAFLKQDAEGLAYLTSDKLTKYSGGRVELEHK